MASMDSQWQQVDRSDGVQEYFMKGEFITSDTWTESNPPVFYRKNGTRLDYPYQKDSFTFSGNTYGSDIKNKINVTEITYATPCESAVSIIKDGGFRPGTKSIPGIGESKLIWFELKVEEEQIDVVRRNYKQCAYDVLQDKFLKGLADDVADSAASEFANTAPFQPMSRYGNVKFTLSIREVLSQYQKQFCGNDCVIPEIRKLGTFAYGMETMHVILVCPPCTPSVNNFPILHNHDEDPIIVHPDGTCTWRPHSTGDQSIAVTKHGKLFKTYKRWEHFTFAFVVPEGYCLHIDDLNNHVTLCLHLSKEFRILCIHNAIFTMLQLIQRTEESYIRLSLANMLIFMICGYCEEWPLYQKTVKLDKVIGKVTVQDEWVKHSFKVMLPMEFEGLNWSPLIRSTIYQSF